MEEKEKEKTIEQEVNQKEKIENFYLRYKYYKTINSL